MEEATTNPSVESSGDKTNPNLEPPRFHSEVGPRITPLWKQILGPLASLKLTVGLFAISIFLVFTGTLAQTRMDIWDVMSQYFRSFWAWIEFRVFFPPSFFPSMPDISGGFYFPGGWTIGLLMMANLLAAHLVRFTAQARGMRLAVGVGVIAVGCVMTWLVIEGGSNPNGFQGTPYLDWSTMWMLMKLTLAGTAIAGAWWSTQIPTARLTERRLLQVLSYSLGGLVSWLLYEGDQVQLGDSSMRILWQLTQGTVASGVLLAGCYLAFAKRAGIVLLHAGVGLLMFSELLVGMTHVESQMFIREGQTSNYSQDTRDLELAIIDHSGGTTDEVVVIPRSLLRSGQLISDPVLPCDVQLATDDKQVPLYFQNCSKRPLKPGEKALATSGRGLKLTVENIRASTGTDSGGGLDTSAAYVKFLEKGTGKELATYLLIADPNRQLFGAGYREDLKLGDKTYEVSLRFKRIYKPYEITLRDARSDKYVGTSTVKNYSSEVRLVDKTRGIERDVKIWMNNPMRYTGETFYQSQYWGPPDLNFEMTGLQVVSNNGWMIPYVSCMIVAVGMLFQFTITLLRFVNRRWEAYKQAQQLKDPGAELGSARTKGKRGETIHDLPESPESWQSRWSVPLLVMGITGLYIASTFRVAKPSATEMHLADFGKLPVAYEGRIKPLDTLARNALRVISDREVFCLADDPNEKKKLPAIRWLIDVIADPGKSMEHPVFRIDYQEIIDLFGLERRKTLRYSLDELLLHKKFNVFIDEAQGAGRKQAALRMDPKGPMLTLRERRILELQKRIDVYRTLRAAFDPPEIDLPSEEEREGDPGKMREHFNRLMASVQSAREQMQQLEELHPPLVVAVNMTDEERKEHPGDKRTWKSFPAAWLQGFVEAKIGGREADEATVLWTEMISAYRGEKVPEFNKALREYQGMLHLEHPKDFNPDKISYEAFFNHANFFGKAQVLYLVAFIISAASWLFWAKPLNRTAMAIIALAFVVHTTALVLRIYISGRPPVTNIYSSAIFIGWGGVVFGLALEALYKLGFGNALAAVSGYLALQIAYNLGMDGDTFTVLQAVLDTQFWLATHVVTITLGYSTTYVAGFLGMFYIMTGVFTPNLDKTKAKELSRMIYGILCFSIFFSFVGTVLGGLWADDSWGRFWGWDPKENGALIIVLWNALVLHARWGKMVGDRGTAILAMGGNIVTTWSYFGTNELGVGLHSYGKTEGTLQNMLLFVGIQLALMAIGCLPQQCWRSKPEAGLDSAEIQPEHPMATISRFIHYVTRGI